MLNCAGADSVVYLSLDGLVKAVNEGATDNTFTESSHHIISNNLCDNKLKGNGEESSADTACKNSNVNSPRQDGTDASRNGYCVACLSGHYPIALDW